MSSLWKCVITFVITAILASAAWFFVMHMRTEKITEEFQGEIAQLTATLDALGPDVECYTVSEEFSYHYNYDTVGQILTEEAITPITVPSSLVGEAYITDISQIVGRYCKVNIVPGTPITYDLLMSEWFDDTLRDVDLAVNARVVGMRVGDYVDIRMTLPFGQDYVIFPHKRIQYIGEQTLKFYLTEAEWQTWQAATVDYYINQQYGCRIYLTKYLEPGVQKSALAYYAPSDEVYEIMRKDPNIVASALSSLTSLHNGRGNIDELFNQFVNPERDTIESQAGKIQGGRSQWSSSVMTDYRTRKTEDDNRSSSSDEEEDTYEEELDVEINLEGAPGTENESQGSSDGMQTQQPQSGMQSGMTGETQPTVEETGPVPAGQVGEPAGAGTEETTAAVSETTVAPEFESQAPVTETEPAETTAAGLEDPDFAG